MISVIVPVYNGAKTIEQCLDALLDQSIPAGQYEIIVVNDGSRDGTVELVERYLRRLPLDGEVPAVTVTLLSQPNRGPAAARNLGAEHACGDVLLFTDADCSPTRTWIEEMVKPLQDPGVVGVKGTYRTHQREVIPRFVQLEYESKYDRMRREPTIDFVDSYSAGYRRTVFEENGGFDPVFPIPSAEDVDFSFRLARKGYRMVFAPQAVVYHYHDETLGDYLRRKFWYGFWRVLVYARYPEKVAMDSHTPQSLKIQVVSLLVALLAAAAILSGGRLYQAMAGAVCAAALCLFLVSLVPFCLQALRKDPFVAVLSPILIILRAGALGVGIVTGSLKIGADRLFMPLAAPRRMPVPCARPQDRLADRPGKTPRWRPAAHGMTPPPGSSPAAAVPRRRVSNRRRPWQGFSGRLSGARVWLCLSLILTLALAVLLFVDQDSIRSRLLRLLPPSASVLELIISVPPPSTLPVTWKADVPPFGVQILAEESKDAAALARARAVGARWVRVVLYWGNVEPTNRAPDAYRWRSYDALFARLSEAGLTPIVNIMGNPAWAATNPSGPIDKVSLTELADFLGALVRRYQGPPYHVRHWELYNEPDDLDHWGGRGHDYAAMLQVAYRAIKQADPQARVLLGGLAYDGFVGEEGGHFDRRFLDDVLAAGGGRYFDVMSFHYYGGFYRRWEPYGPDVIGKANYIRGRLARHGLSKPLMVTEIGNPSASTAGDGPYSEDWQARYVVQGLVRSMAAQIEAVIWFTLADYPDPRQHGLLYADFSPKPAYRAYQTLVQELAGATYIRPLSRAESGSPDIEGYLFSRSGREKMVVWTRVRDLFLVKQELTRKMVVVGTRARLVDKLGAETMITDGGAGDGDGAVNGQVVLSVDASPVYVSVTGASLSTGQR